MESESPEPWSSGRTRRWRVPPPLTRGGELLEGGEILDEMSGPIAVLLWKSLRNVTLWAVATPREQAELFSPGAQAQRLADIAEAQPEEELREPLAVFAELLGHSAGVSRERLALACRRVAQWADGQSCFRTSLAFVQAAALTCPADADLAFHVGRLARHQLQHARAESWYRRAIMLGRQAGNWHAYARAYSGLGNLAMQRGSLPGARRAHIKALRSARRHGISEIEAQALHDLFIVCNESGDTVTAQRYAASAFRLYGSQHPNAATLAHDLCVLWMAQGDFVRALPVLRAVLPHLSGGTQLLGSANLARAAGCAGDRETFNRAWDEAHTLLEEYRGTRFAAQSLLSLGRGAAGLGEWDRAIEVASRAIELARQSGETNIVFEAESVLDHATARRSSPVLRETAEPAYDSTEWREQADNLATRMCHAFAAGA